jgi:uncharacterized protein (UPF0332 family)
MIEQNRIEEASRNVRQYVTDGLLKTRDNESKKLVSFFMDQAERSLRTAAVVFELSTDTAAKQAMRLERDFESHLWVIVTSYYSMFYAALALLASQGIRAGRQLVHKVVADALIHFFISNKRLVKMLEAYEEARDTSLELIGREELMKRLQKRADELVIAYERERLKRSKFQYDIGEMAKRGYAETSLQRARDFVSEVRGILARQSSSA